MRTMLSKSKTIHLLLAFDIETKRLLKQYGERLKWTIIDPWRHNRHMTIVCDGKQPKLAIYFARRLRSPVITAVYLDGMRDVKRLTDVYWQRWDEAIAEEALTKSKHNNTAAEIHKP